jgi:N-acetylmuramoyl-L-alanine amidase
MRTINRIFIHSTATPAGRITTSADIDRWHREAGKNGKGYHYLIGINGEICEGRPLSVAGAHVAGQNANSVGIAYVGGGLPNNPQNTLTPVQSTALANLIRELKKQFPNATVHGHGEFGNTSCPSFDVQVWLKQNNI